MPTTTHFNEMSRLTMDAQENALAGLGENLGIALKFDGNDRCLLSVNKKTIIAIQKQADGFLLQGILADLSDRLDPSFLEKILALNLLMARLNKGTMTLSPKKNAVLLVKTVKGKIDSSHLEIALGDFANSVENLATTLEADRAAQDSDRIATLSFV